MTSGFGGGVARTGSMTSGCGGGVARTGSGATGWVATGSRATGAASTGVLSTRGSGSGWTCGSGVTAAGPGAKGTTSTRRARRPTVGASVKNDGGMVGTALGSARRRPRLSERPGDRRTAGR